MRARAWVVSAGAVLISLAAVSCGNNSKGSKVDLTSDGGSSGTSATGAGGSGTSVPGNGSGAQAGTTPLLNLPDSGTDDAGSSVPSGDTCGNMCAAGTTCSPETCDGVDNNCDGIVDNVDKDGDGICDCLLVATLGLAGTWGQGDVFATWLSARSNNGAASLADQTLTPELLAKYEVIVAEDVHSNHAYSDAEVQALQAWVAAGGGFMTLIGYANLGEEVNVNRLLAPFGMSYAHKQAWPKGGGASTVPITDWVPHPIDQGVTAVGVDQGCPVQGMGTVIATNAGLNVGLAQEVLPGHVFMWGDEWITYNSEWQQHTDYQVELLWVNAIKWLTAANKCQVPVPPTFPVK